MKNMKNIQNWKQFNENNNVDILFDDIKDSIISNKNSLILSRPGVTLKNDLDEILNELIRVNIIDSYQIIDGIYLTMDDIDIDNDVIVILGVDSISFLELSELFDDINGLMIAVSESLPSNKIKSLFDNII